MVLIMDEVDGMSAGDRGGVADLIQTLKGAKLPIICICNDKYNQKLKSLRNHCLELDYRSALIPAKHARQLSLLELCRWSFTHTAHYEHNPDKHGLGRGAP